jgi:hypothetical protein
VSPHDDHHERRDAADVLVGGQRAVAQQQIHHV